MSQVEERRSESTPTASPANHAGVASDDSRIIRALQEYQAALRAGHKPSRSEFQARYRDVADALGECLDGLDFVHVVAPQLSDPGFAPCAGSEISPEAPLGDFRIVREIGRGGMGVVYEAVQISLGRRVALKVLPFAAAMDAKQLQRFKNEAQAAAHLHHTNIVPVFGVGCERGVHYYAMQFIEGQTLAAIIQELRQTDQRRMTNDERMTNVQGADAHTRSRHSTLGLLSSLGIRHPSFYRAVANLGLQAAEALEHAHELGVVHRDIKPANLLVDVRGNLWITDFGLAHCQSQVGLTMSGDLVGTLRYMSPEQALAKRLLIDHRTDIYSLGVTLYELLTLEPAFNGSDREELLRQIAFEEPQMPQKRNKAIPHELETIVLKAIQKSPEARYASAQELADDLRRFLEDRPIQAKRPTLVQRAAKWARRHKTVVRAAAVVLGLAILAVAVSTLLIERAQQRTQQEERMREVVLPTLRRLIRQKDYAAAFELAEKAEQAIAADPTLAELRPDFTSIWTVTTEPPDADVYAKPYERPQEDWQYLGRSPLNQVRLPRGFFRWRFTKDGFTSVEGFRDPVDGQIQFRLDRVGVIPPGMVRVSGNAYRANLYSLADLNGLDLEDYWIDRCEVTNRQFKDFIDRGGYRERKYWKHFHDHQTALAVSYASTAGLLASSLGRGALLTASALFPGKTDQMVLSWEEAMKKFLDQTGKPGPFTWRSGTYPTGEGDYPVRGVCWYEAAAYAEYARKSLPTVVHWVRASGQQHAADIAPLSNFGRAGPAPADTCHGLGPFGTLDMAGNVREWCWNRNKGNSRFILEGAWNEPAYVFSYWDTASSLDRSPANGFRCVRYMSEKLPPAAFEDMLLAGHRDYEKEKPVSDEVFQVCKSFYAYDRAAPLNARTESVEPSDDTIHETVSFEAAYNKERVMAHLYLPRRGTQPYQTVVYFPGNVYVSNTAYPRENPPSDIAFLVRSGRAVLWPVYKGTYQRWDPESPLTLRPISSIVRRSWRIRWYQDFARSVDYLQERRDIIDIEKLAYFGRSWGAEMGLTNLALDDRFKVAVLTFGGLPVAMIPLPEFDALNFAPRVHIPVLMINSRDDPILPLETSQKPMFELLGTPQKDKRHDLYDGPTHGVAVDRFKNKMLNWLDRYLGKVR
jgi:eukaryotic-like serine/threonine-protein kinase